MTETNYCTNSNQAVLSLCDEFWQWRLNESPELATQCGLHQYDDRWDDLREEAYINRENKAKSFLSQAANIDLTSCSEDVGLSHKLIVDSLNSYLNAARFKSYLMPINKLEGIHVDAVMTIGDMKSETESDLQKLVKRLERLPDRIRQTINTMKLGVESGIAVYECSLRVVPEQINQILSADLNKNQLLKPFSVEHPNIPAITVNKYTTHAKDILLSSVIPAFQELKDYIEKEYMNNLRPHLGINTLENGIEWYQQALNFHLTCSMTPQEVHELGMREVARIGMQIVELARKEGLPENLPDLLQAIVEKQKNIFSTPEDVLEYVQNLCYKRIRPKLKEYFKILPEIDMKIEAIPEYLASSPVGYYRNGTVDGSRDGKYFINTNNLEDCLPYSLPALSLHEGEPGHHLQSVYSLAATHLPDFRRYFEDLKYYLAPFNFPLCTAYVEGWGLYCEALGEEMGIYENSYELLGRYNMEILRAARLVVDTGMHAFGWSKEKAVQYMTNYTMETKTAIEHEVERYITWPGQACGYKVGEIKIWELRQKAQNELGPNFDIKEFHHRILSCGAVPVRILEDIVDNFIQENRPREG